MSRSFITALVVLAAASAAGCSIDVRGEEVVVREEKRFTIDGAANVSLNTFDGSIEVRSWDRNEILVEIARRASSPADAEALQVRATQEADRLVIEAPNPRIQRRDVIHLGSWQSPSVSLVVTTPRRLTLLARTGDGPIVARDLSGTIALHTGDGSIRAERVAGEVTMDSGDGPMFVTDIQGGLDLHTGDGNVEVSGRLDALRINTGDGVVRIDARAGSIMKSDWTITTGDGPITIRVPSEFDAEIDAFTGDGRVSATGITSSDRPRDRDDESGLLRGRFGNGGQTLRLRTGDGPIAITR
jgi:hypothetical protein